MIESVISRQPRSILTLKNDLTVYTILYDSDLKKFEPGKLVESGKNLRHYKRVEEPEIIYYYTGIVCSVKKPRITRTPDGNYIFELCLGRGYYIGITMSLYVGKGIIPGGTKYVRCDEGKDIICSEAFILQKTSLGLSEYRDYLEEIVEEFNNSWL